MVQTENARKSIKERTRVGETVKARLARKRAELEDVTKQMKPPALPMHDALRARLSVQQAEIQREIDDLEAKLAGARTS